MRDTRTLVQLTVAQPIDDGQLPSVARNICKHLLTFQCHGPSPTKALYAGINVAERACRNRLDEQHRTDDNGMRRLGHTDKILIYGREHGLARLRRAVVGHFERTPERGLRSPVDRAGFARLYGCSLARVKGEPRDDALGCLIGEHLVPLPSWDQLHECCTRYTPR